MKISLNEIKAMNERYQTSGDIAQGGVEKLIEKIGAQLGGVDEVIDLGKKYQGIVVAKVVSCEQHPNADKLKVCLIDDGGVVSNVERVSRDQAMRADVASSSERVAQGAVHESTASEQHSEDGENVQKSGSVGGSADEQDVRSHGLVQVVCGAPNVAEGMLVAWLPPGSIVPSTIDKDPYALETREIRGQISNGMIASASELAINDDHSGILEITDDKAKPGDDFAKTFGLDDYIVDIENKMFTHRPDLFGFLGVARELAGIQQMPFKSPDWYSPNIEFPAIETEELALAVKNELPELVPRFMAVAMSNVKVSPSPIWLQIYLAKIGQKSINNIVDYTNLYMLLTSQPLHAYDYDKVKARSNGDTVIVVRYPREDEKVKLLNGKEITPRSEAIMIATDKELVGMGGVMGGADTEVDDSTTNIILECANFDMYSIRRTAMEHGLFTDAVTRFTKGQSPLQNAAVLARIISKIQQSGGKVASKLVDDSHISDAVMQRQSVHPPVNVSAEFINSRLGLDLPAEEMMRILQNVEFVVEVVRGNMLVIKAPFWRTDIEISEDIVEEIGRLYGYDHLPLDLPKRNIVPVGPDELLYLKANLRQELSTLGANEVLTYSFVHGNLLDRSNQDKDIAFKISNALSPDLQYYRLSLTPSLLDKLHMNIKAGYSEFAIFEIGKVHAKNELDDEGLPREFERLAFVYSADDKLKKEGAAFYQARLYLNQLSNHNVVPFSKDLLQGHKMMTQLVAPYDESRSGLVWNGKMPVGIVGEFKPSVARNFKLPSHAAGFEMFISALKPNSQQSYKPLSRFPSISQDICLQVPVHLPYGDLGKEFDEALKSNVSEHETVDWQPIDIYTSEKLDSQKRITYRVRLTSNERTLVEANLSSVLQKVTDKLQASLHVQRI